MADRRPVGFGRRDDGGAKHDETSAVPAGTERLDDDAMARLIPVRDARGHKGTFGKILVIAGSLDYAGAALLVCRAAGRAGAGLVTLAVPESLQPLFAGKVVEATTMPLPDPRRHTARFGTATRRATRDPDPTHPRRTR